jgi:hypothetical protein
VLSRAGNGPRIPSDPPNLPDRHPFNQVGRQGGSYVRRKIAMFVDGLVQRLSCSARVQIRSRGCPPDCENPPRPQSWSPAWDPLHWCDARPPDRKHDGWVTGSGGILRAGQVVAPAYCYQIGESRQACPSTTWKRCRRLREPPRWTGTPRRSGFQCAADHADEGADQRRGVRGGGCVGEQPGVHGLAHAGGDGE